MRLAYGKEAALNECVLSRISSDDREFWAKLYERLPSIVHAAAVAGDEVPAKLDELFTLKIAEKGAG